jgi:hypothetical protein
MIHKGGPAVFDWNTVTAVLDEKTWLPLFPFELQFLGYSEGMYDSRVGRIVWEAFVRSLPSQEALPTDETVRDGWHFTKERDDKWAILTSVDRHADGGPDHPNPEIPVDSLPPHLYGIAMNPRFIEDVILDRRYPRPATCYDAVRIILRAWEESSHGWMPTLWTIHGVPCVII